MRTYVLDPAAERPLYEQLYRAMKEEILSGSIGGGEKLPSKRALAEHLSVSRVTVETAYNQLLAEGYVESRPRSGYYVEPLEALPQRPQPLPEASVPEQQAPPTVSAQQFPFSIWARLMRAVILDRHDQLLLPPPNIGLPDLRRAIAGELRRSRGMEVDPDCIVIGAGAEYLYNMLLQLLGREHRFGLENPGHQKIHRVYEANGVTVCPIELDDSGVNLASLGASGATVLHISPSHQFPTGIVTPIGRRRQLMSWLGASPDRWLVEDDYDSEFRFSGKILPTMTSMDTLGRVIYLNTFSKTITPALRISYMVLPKALMNRYLRLLGFYSCTVPTLEQLTLARFLEEGYFEKHVGRMKRRYRQLREAFLTQLRQSPRAGAIEVLGDEAGLHLLLRLHTTRSDDRIEQTLAGAGVWAAGLSRYRMGPARAGDRGLVVLPYTDLSPEELPHLVALLEALVEPEK